MQSHQTIISPPSLPIPTETVTPSWLRFTLLCTLFLLAAIWLEPLFAPLCRATASQVALLLGMAGFSPRVQGVLVTLNGFTVRIVTECTPLYACLLYCAFVLAQPASWRRTFSGLLLGTAVITAANLLRISFVTAAGTIVAPILFEIIHVYLGQVAMLMLVVAAALVWLRWSSGGAMPFPFLFRAGLLASALFVPWLAMNRFYVEQLDNLVALLFSLLYTGYKLLTPRPFPIYNHTFAVPFFLALIMASRNSWKWHRLTAMVGCVSIIVGWHTLFRISHTVWTALDVSEIEPFHQAIYLLGQFLLPFLLWMRFDTGFSRQGRGFSHDPVKPVILAVVLALVWSSPALAESVVLIHPTGRGGFAIKADNLNRVTEAEIRVDYKSEDQTPPQVRGAGLGAQATIEVQADTPGSFTIRLKSSKPLSGHVMLATAQLQGSITFLTAWLRNEKGQTETPRISIKNPTDEELSAMAAKRPTSPPPVAASPPAVAPVNNPSKSATTSTPSVSSAVTAEVVVSTEPDYSSRPITFSRRKSVLEQIRSFSGERTPAALARLFERSDSMFIQEPPILISDGSETLRITIRTKGRSERAPQFYISGGSCIGLTNGDDGAWILEIVPEQGNLASSVSVLSGNEMIEYPLAVAPPLELFETAGAGESELEYVVTANRLAKRQNVSP
jgi:exosortase H (IPTLxxWG-CTERM-specific)